LAEKRSFKGPLQSRRCIVPADGYYEWQKTSDGKQPFEFSRRDGALLAIAGLWETNRRASTDGQTIHSCTLITTAANPMAAEVHDRMPALLDAEGIEIWLDPEQRDPQAVSQVLRPAPEDWLQSRPVSKRLGNVRNEGAELLEAESGDHA
jgi:putative SOS response-associated peptidase YedK